MTGLFRTTLSFCGTVVKYFCVAHCTLNYVGNLVVCSGPSMETTLYSNDILLTDCITPRRGKIQRGDIIISRLPSQPATLICKRIIGMSGDRLFYIKPSEDSRIHKTINLTNLVVQSGESCSNAEFVELIDKCKKKFGMKEVIVPPGHVWLEGDNQSNSGDSRYYGCVPEGLIQSRVIARIWPLEEFKLFSNK